MATEWGCTLQEKKLLGAYGTRDIVIIAQDDSLQGPDIQPRCSLQLTDSDRNQLQRLGIPTANWQDDATIMAARCALDKDYTLLPIERSISGEMLTKNYVVSKIEEYMKRTMKAGLTVYYFGPGKCKSGDWCFKDGYIAFKELADMYLKHLKGRVLTIHTDCSYAGCWVETLVQFLQDMGTQPCGHSVKEKGILMKVFASCQSNEIPHQLAYSLRGTRTDKNTGAFSIEGKEIEKTQHIITLDATVIRCKNKNIDAKCTLNPEDTWQKWSLKDRIFLVRGNDKGRPAWHYLLLVDDADTIDKFKELTQGPNSGEHTLNCKDYGQVLKSGWGTEPPNEVKDWMEKIYGAS